MSKYSRNAGFKGYEEQLRENNDESDVKKSPTKMLVIISSSVIALVILVTVVISAMFNTTDEVPNKVEVSFTQGEEETLDYESVFGHKEDEELGTSQSSEKSNNSSSSKDSSNSSSKSSSKTSNNSKAESSSHSSSDNSSSYYIESHNTGNYNNSSNYYSSSSYVPQSSQKTQNSKQSSQSSKQSSQNDTPKTISVSSVSISKSSISLTVGDSKTITANVSPSNASNKSITWSSTNNSIATVSGGKITAKSAGTATIIASSNNGKKAYCNITVKAKETEPIRDNRYVQPQTQTIRINQPLTIRLYGDEYCTWEISNPYVVKVTSKGNAYITIIGNKAGITNITAKTKDGKTFKAKIGVVK